MPVIDFTLKHIEKLDESLVDLLNKHNYPMNEIGAAVLVSAGIHGLQNAGVDAPQIIKLVLMIVANQSTSEKKSE